MTLGTVFSSLAPMSDSGPPPRTALVLMGGGARTAYQVGAMQGIVQILGPSPRAFFDILVGTSAGALNAAYLACHASAGQAAVERLAAFWGTLRSDHVYHVESLRSAHQGLRWATLISPAWMLRRLPRSFLDAEPLARSLRRAVDFGRIGLALRDRHLQALAVTASSYTSGLHWTFYQTADALKVEPWQHPGRRSVAQPVAAEHLLASAAIPFVFPAVPLQVNGRTEYFGDGSMRQLAPLSPAFHLGATRILAIGVGQPERSGMADDPDESAGQYPKMAQIATHAMASVFHDTLEADVEQALRVNEGLRRLRQAQGGAALPYRTVEVLSLQPSCSLDSLAREHARSLPEPAFKLLKMLGGTQGAGAALASYLLFEPPFVQALMALGRADALAQRERIEAFFAGRPVPAAGGAGSHAAVP
ncbi:patatin-like phospholipase family protein [Caldimonas caldifontis]|uniref:Patatin n=1 Tax=Caldimonas caldifontis TaxID=1452508 RepID=A0A2S5SUA1_9BURK|nr:patatin-like phospholipase family protein [Caldimonas caldifontis]PPE66264.1 patatin [Caldimonas caldifontis]